MARMTPHLKGTLITTLGVTILSFDSLLIRLIESDSWTLLFWRGALMSLVLLAYHLWRDAAGVLAKLRRPSHSGLMAAVAYTGSTVCFVNSIHHTQVAATLVIINTAPFFAALLGFFFLKETIQRRTGLAIVGALSGIALVFGSELQGARLVGNLYAVGTAVSLACYFVVLRHGRDRDMTHYMIIAGGLIALTSLAFGAAPLSPPAGDWGGILLLCGFIIPLSFYLISIGPRFLPAAEVSLLMMLEAVLGPLFVWWVLAEVPTAQVLLGGIIVLATITVHSLWSVRRQPG